MTFYDVSIKMLKANYKRYRLYFICNLVAVALFYCFAAIFTNQLFMNRDIVDPMITSNIYAPSVFTGVFLILFIPYSYSAFLRNRKQEYGILMTLGMSETQVLKNMIFENCIIAGISLSIGLIVGTVISFVFYFIIHHVIGIAGLYWYFNPSSYVITALLYGVTIVISLILGILELLKMQIVDLLREKFKAEKQGKLSIGMFLVGALFIIIAVYIMIKYNPNQFLLSLAIMFTGTFLLLSNSVSMKKYTDNMFLGYRKRHILELSFVRQHYRSQSRICILASWLIGFSVFMTGLIGVLASMKNEVVYSYSPYDMVYSRIFGMNQVDNSEIESLLNKNGVSVKSVKQVEYLRNQVFNILPVSQVNETFHCNYKVSEGKFKFIFQINPKDGYEHDMFAPKTLSLYYGDKEHELREVGSDVRILFNSNPTFADATIVINDVDFHKVASNNKRYWAGTMELYSFHDWKHSQNAIDAVQKYLQHKNHVDSIEQKRYYKATSFIESYTTAKQAVQFLIFLMSFILILFCITADIMIHFKIKAESEDEQRILSGLYRLGVNAQEMLGMIYYKNKYYFIPQVMIGLLIGGFYNCILNKTYGIKYGLASVGYCMIIGVILITIQFVFLMKYTKRELRELSINEITV